MVDDLLSMLDSVAPLIKTPRKEGNIYTKRTSDVEYSTDTYYVDLCRKALGGKIACDPASSDRDNEFIKAQVYYTIERSGLADVPWPSPIFLNPPGSRRSDFLDRAAWHAARGAEMVVCLQLKHLSLEAAQKLMEHVRASHIPQGRPLFLDSRTRLPNQSPTDGAIFVYVGANPERFAQVFSRNRGITQITSIVRAQPTRNIQAVIK